MAKSTHLRHLENLFEQYQQGSVEQKSDLGAAIVEHFAPVIHSECLRIRYGKGFKDFPAFETNLFGNSFTLKGIMEPYEMKDYVQIALEYVYKGLEAYDPQKASPSSYLVSCAMAGLAADFPKGLLVKLPASADKQGRRNLRFVGFDRKKFFELGSTQAQEHIAKKTKYGPDAAYKETVKGQERVALTHLALTNEYEPLETHTEWDPYFSRWETIDQDEPMDVLDFIESQSWGHVAKLSDGIDVPSNEPSPEDDLQTKELKDIITSSLNHVEPRRQNVIRMWMGLDGEEKSPAQIGKEIGVSRTRIGQLIAQGLGLLKQQPKVSELSDTTVELTYADYAKTRAYLPEIPNPKINPGVVRDRINYEALAQVRKDAGLLQPWEKVNLDQILQLRYPNGKPKPSPILRFFSTNPYNSSMSDEEIACRVLEIRMRYEVDEPKELEKLGLTKRELEKKVDRFAWNSWYERHGGHSTFRW